MKKTFKVSGTAFIGVTWQPSSRQVIRVCHHDAAEETCGGNREVKLLRSGSTAVKVEFHITTDAESEEKAERIITRRLEDPGYWQVLTIIDDRDVEMRTKVKKVMVFVSKVEEVASSTVES